LWAAQGVGQDVLNLVVVPALFAVVWLARRGSARAVLVWFGLTLYLAYSYVLYAFFVHFNALFLVYVAVLGLSVYALVGAARELDFDRWARIFSSASGERPLSVLLAISGVLFAALWLSEILPALAAGRPPASATDAGLIVNPVHVLDLAFVVPAMVIASVCLWRRHPAGFIAAQALATFMVAMGLAIMAMMVTVSARGLGSAAAAIPMALLVAVTIWLTMRVRPS
jgi:hypothetical protein